MSFCYRFPKAAAMPDDQTPLPPVPDGAREPELAALLGGPDTPGWLRRVAALACEPDPVDAANGLEALAAAFDARAHRIGREALAVVRAANAGHAQPGAVPAPAAQAARGSLTDALWTPRVAHANAAAVSAALDRDGVGMAPAVLQFNEGEQAEAVAQVFTKDRDDSRHGWRTASPDEGGSCVLTYDSDGVLATIAMPASEAFMRLALAGARAALGRAPDDGDQVDVTLNLSDGNSDPAGTWGAEASTPEGPEAVDLPFVVPPAVVDGTQ